MDSWSETKSLILMTVVVLAFYLLGRIVAEALDQLSLSGLPPV
jgi:hypothetical protein